MDKELITSSEYTLLCRRSNWVESSENYKLERGLEDMFMDDVEFDEIDSLISHNDDVFKFLREFTLHGDTNLRTVKGRLNGGYFASLNILSENGIVLNEGRRTLTPKAHAFIFEYGRRKYDTD